MKKIKSKSSAIPESWKKNMSTDMLVDLAINLHDRDKPEAALKVLKHANVSDRVINRVINHPEQRRRTKRHT